MGSKVSTSFSLYFSLFSFLVCLSLSYFLLAMPKSPNQRDIYYFTRMFHRWGQGQFVNKPLGNLQSETCQTAEITAIFALFKSFFILVFISLSQYYLFVYYVCFVYFWITLSMMQGYWRTSFRLYSEFSYSYGSTLGCTECCWGLRLCVSVFISKYENSVINNMRMNTFM